jgi:hypothetical protein
MEAGWHSAEDDTTPSGQVYAAPYIGKIAAGRLLGRSMGDTGKAAQAAKSFISLRTLVGWYSFRTVAGLFWPTRPQMPSLEGMRQRSTGGGNDGLGLGK